MRINVGMERRSRETDGDEMMLAWTGWSTGMRYFDNVN